MTSGALFICKKSRAWYFHGYCFVCVFLKEQKIGGKKRIASKESSCCRLYLIEKQLKDNQVYLIHLERHEGEKRWRIRKKKREEKRRREKEKKEGGGMLSSSSKTVSKYTYCPVEHQRNCSIKWIMLIWIKEISSSNQFLQVTSFILLFFLFCSRY